MNMLALSEANKGNVKSVENISHVLTLGFIKPCHTSKYQYIAMRQFPGHGVQLNYCQRATNNCTFPEAVFIFVDSNINEPREALARTVSEHFPIISTGKHLCCCEDKAKLLPRPARGHRFEVGRENLINRKIRR